MPLSAVKQRTNTGKAVGGAVSFPADYDAQSGSVTPVYASNVGNVVVDFSAVPTGSNSMVRDNAAGDSKFGQFTVDLFFGAPPSTAMVMSELRNASAKVANILTNVSSGNPTILMRGGADVSLTGWTTATVLALNAWYRIQIAVQVGTSTTTGKTKAQLIRLSDGAVLASGESTTLNSGTANVAFHQTGKVSATGTLGLQLDNLAFNDAAYAYIPAAADPANYPPTCSAGGNQTVESGSDVVLRGTDDDPDGVIASRVWAQTGGAAIPRSPVAGEPGSAALRAPAQLTDMDVPFTYTVTDDDGVPASSSMVLTIRKALVVYTHPTRGDLPLVWERVEAAD